MYATYVCTYLHTYRVQGGLHQSRRLHRAYSRRHRVQEVIILSSATSYRNVDRHHVRIVQGYSWCREIAHVYFHERRGPRGCWSTQADLSATDLRAGPTAGVPARLKGVYLVVQQPQRVQVVGVLERKWNSFLFFRAPSAPRGKPL